MHLFHMIISYQLYFFKHFYIFFVDKHIFLIYNLYCVGELAQLARASRLHREGQGFESLILHHREVAQLGRAFGLGPRGCRFKSCLPDQFVYKAL